ncbi:citrate lyase holo-[acyl-carrier protein] synthase [Clostridium sediminicola]|uniref:citrate lyase holo-[acyl-carrier protein] synthase n=1 Tax=Clostridium sediminicola TaxID=3114879 RepID=UPI0031F1E4D0
MNKEKMMLYKILQSRELRWKNQKDFIKKFNCSLVSFTLNIPGDQKDSPLYKQAHKEGLKILTDSIHEKNLEILNKKVEYKDTGAEAYISVQSDAYKLKALTVNIEESTPLGRLYDFDVIDKNLNILSRKELGFRERRCFICKCAANVCRRKRTHSIEELTNYIDKLVNDYFSY